MRVLLMATMAASALAIGGNVEPAQSLPLGGRIAGPDAAVQKVQQKEKGMAPGTESQGPGKGTQGPGDPSKGGPGMGGPGMGGGKMQGQGGAQLRSGERTERGTQLRTGERGTRGGGGAEFRYRERRGTYGYGPRTREGGVYIEGERRGRRGAVGGVRVGPGYGYVSGCAWLRQRALETDSAYWWRRYRACRGG